MSLTKKCCYGAELLPNVLYEMVKKSLGSKSITCVFDNDECIFTSDMETLLSSLTIEHPVGEVIFQALGCHKEQHGDGVGSCMFMITRIAKAVNLLEEMGIKTSMSLAVIGDVINHLSQQVQQISIPVHISSFSAFQDEALMETSDLNKSHSVDFSERSSCHNSGQTQFASGTINYHMPGGFLNDSDEICANFGASSSQIESPSHKDEMEKVKLDYFMINPSVDAQCSDSMNKSSVDAQRLDSMNESSQCLDSMNKSTEETQHSELMNKSSVDAQCLDSMNKSSVDIQCLETLINCVNNQGVTLQPTSNLSSSKDKAFDKTTNTFSLSNEINESDPVVLKMCDLPHAQENNANDVDWFFDRKLGKEIPEQHAFNSDSDAIIDFRAESMDSTCVSNPHAAISSPKDNHSQRESHNTILCKNADNVDSYVEKYKHPALTDAHQCDSDFEDCFDDIENRKQVLVVVERIEGDSTNNNPVLNSCQPKSFVMEKRMEHNIRRHFTSTEFETTSSIPSLSKSALDTEFSDCFEDRLFENSDNNLSGSESQTLECSNVSKAESIPIKSETVTKPTTNTQAAMPHSDTGNHVPPSLGKGSSSEIENLNSLLSSINLKKFHSTREVLLTSRHNFKEKDCEEFSGICSSKPNVELGQNAVIIQSPLLSSACLKKTESVSKAESILFKSETVTKPTTNTQAAMPHSDSGNHVPPSLGKGSSSEIENLNSLLSSINLKKFHSTREVLLTSRHNFEEKDCEEFSGICSSKPNFELGQNAVIIQSPLLSSACLKKTESDSEPALKHIEHASERDINSDRDPSIFLTKSQPLSQIGKLNPPLAIINHKHSSMNKTQIPLSNKPVIEKRSEDNCHSHQTSEYGEFPSDLKEIPHEKTKSVLAHNHSHSSKSKMVDSVYGNSVLTHRLTQSGNSKRVDSVHICCKESFCIKENSNHHQPITEVPNANFHKLDLPNAEYVNQMISKSTEYSSEYLYKENSHQALHLPVDLVSLMRCHEDLMEVMKSLICSHSNLQIDELRKRLNPDLIHCLSLESPKSSKVLICGLAIPCTIHHLDKLRNNFGHPLNVLLINGDLTQSHHHKGYKATIAKKNVIRSVENIQSQNGDARWASFVVEKIKQLHISVVLLRGFTNDIVVDTCMTAGIVLLPNITFRVLKIISHQLKTDLLCYAENASEMNVCQLCFEPLNPSWMDGMNDDHGLILSNMKNVKSVVLREPCALAAQMSEEKFWKCFHRVCNAVNDGIVFPGGGITELWCHGQIQEMISDFSKSNKVNQHLPKMRILEAMGDVFHDFADTIKQNSKMSHDEQVLSKPFTNKSGLCIPDDSSLCKEENQRINELERPEKEIIHSFSNSISILSSETDDLQFGKDALQQSVCQAPLFNCHHVTPRSHYDSYSSKLSAWKTAVDVVHILSSLDSLIVTGASEIKEYSNEILL